MLWQERGLQFLKVLREKDQEPGVKIKEEIHKMESVKNKNQITNYKLVDRLIRLLA